MAVCRFCCLADSCFVRLEKSPAPPRCHGIYLNYRRERPAGRAGEQAKHETIDHPLVVISQLNLLRCPRLLLRCLCCGHVRERRDRPVPRSLGLLFKKQKNLPDSSFPSAPSLSTLTRRTASLGSLGSVGERRESRGGIEDQPVNVLRSPQPLDT
ncbi:hypothetical protein TEQG_03252 [Trichophyton equinum CBS 127.97]|uniref:Uncharacterized protein n=1 Tax=Trichophyton equinum (strain ATCC MYA-4606 / CBS 127.97) TaxID=559882 RepID=F2PQQ4_TRIEC|nr:hypothetical protein TEQG_03252 [Trichophyton equinum CBS 127.97]